MRPRVLLLSLFFLGSTPAQAQLVYSPVEFAAIPTLSGVSLILMGLALAAFAAFQGGLRQGRLNSLGALCLAVALASGVSGTRLVSEAYADGGAIGMTVIGFIDSPTGGSAVIVDSALNVFENTSGRFQRIDDVIVPGACPNTDSGVIDGTKRCNPGDVISTGTSGMCYTDCRASGP